MKRGSSLRLTLWPSPCTSVAIVCPLRPGGDARRLRGLGHLELTRRVLHGLDDVDVAGAAAEVARDGLTNLRLARVGGAPQERLARHQHAGRAEAALQPVLLHEALLQRVELAVLLQPLHRADSGALHL